MLDQARRAGDPVPIGRALATATVASELTVLVPTAPLLLNTLRVPVCAPFEGLAFLALGPATSVLLASGAGVLLGAMVPRVRLATTLAVLLPLASDGLEIWGFYATPAVYAYGHFAGYFPGTLYDPDITVTLTYASYRVLTVLWWACAACLLGAVWDPETGRPSWRTTRAAWPLALATLLLFAGAMAGEGEGDALGHWSTAETLTEELGGRREGTRCDVVYPRETPSEDAQRLVDDCDYRVRRAEQEMGVRQAERITAFFFRSADEKRRLMGASNTYVAKPWRREVYLQISDWPHPVLFHEIAHVVAGNVGRTPFRVAWSGGGLLPSPAIIEGTAVAVAWGERDGLTPHQWAKAMVEVDLAPDLESVEGLEFLLQPASRAYTVSGSFVRWMMDTRGRGSVRRLYMDGWEAALDRPLGEAEEDWRRFLEEEVALPPEARALAQARFERPGIFGQICPHRVANLREELGADLAAGDLDAAEGTCREILSLDEGQAGTRAALVSATARRGDLEEAREQLARLEGPPSAALPIVWRARQSLADALWWERGPEAAEPIYRALLEEPMGEDALRQIEVRAFAMDADPATGEALRQLLVPPVGRTNDAATSMFAIGQLDDARQDGLADYLAARQMMFRQRFELADPAVRAARDRGLPLESMRAEARRMEAVTAFGVGDLARSARLWREILREDPGAGDRVESLDWLARIRFVRSHESRPGRD